MVLLVLGYGVVVLKVIDRRDKNTGTQSSLSCSVCSSNNIASYIQRFVRRAMSALGDILDHTAVETHLRHLAEPHRSFSSRWSEYYLAATYTNMSQAKQEEAQSHLSDDVSLTLESLTTSAVDLDEISDLPESGDTIRLEDVLEEEGALEEDASTNQLDAHAKASCAETETPDEDMRSKVARLSKCNAVIFNGLVETRKGMEKEFAVVEKRMRNLWKLYKALLDRVHGLESRGAPSDQDVQRMAKLRAENDRIRFLLRTTLEGMSKEQE